MRDPASFFAALRPRPFVRLEESQVAGFNVLTAAMEAAGWPVAFAAYGLATAMHETAWTMQPIRERGSDDYLKRMYDVDGGRPRIARGLGNSMPGDGVRFAGRGYVQMTGRSNYEKVGERLDLDLVGEPDLALEPDIAARIFVSGMASGWFTGKRLADYLPASGPATYEMFRRARRIVNGTDCDIQIAILALGFQSALSAGGWS